MRKTVLIVDDNAFVKRALEKLLTRGLGVDVREAQNGKEGIDKGGIAARLNHLGYFNAADEWLERRRR